MKGRDTLDSAIEYGRTKHRLIPTPRSADGDKGTRSEEGYRKEKDRWGRKNGEDLPTTIAMDGGAKTGLRLQPAFALWMMGFPEDWCDLADGEMPRSKRQAMQ